MGCLLVRITPGPGRVVEGPRDVGVGAIRGGRWTSVRAPQPRVDGRPLAIWYRYRYHTLVARIAKTLEAMRNAPQNTSYNDLRTVCVHFFGEPRQSGTSHAVFKTPWAGDPRVNIQKSKGGEAKPYQVRQVLKAIDKLKEE